MGFKNKIKYGLVLAGGGTKGAYQIGAWKALKELKINIGAIVGTSIGAINGAFMVQDDLAKMENLYSNIKLENVVSIKKNLDSNKNIFSAKNIFKLLADFTEQKGFENTPLRNIINENIDLERIYNSKVDFGMVTYSPKNKEPLEVFKKDIPKENFVDYILASACFPIYKSQEIDNVKYVDGGFYDNMPINLLLKNNYKDIIVLDISGIGIKKKIADKNVNIKMIKNSEDLGGTFEFNQNQIKKNITLGYLDTMKVFNGLQGHIYYFTNKEFRKIMKLYNVEVIYELEIAAHLLEINKYKIYTYNEFINEIYIAYNKAKKEYIKMKKDLNIKSITVMKKVLLEYKKNEKTGLKNKLILCILEDVVLDNPTLNDWLSQQFSVYIEALKGLKELNEFDK